jgi:3-hydroxyacyl-CoA dehydrogenase
MHKENRLGQKNGIGFIKYETDKKGSLERLLMKTLSQKIIEKSCQKKS